MAYKTILTVTTHPDDTVPQLDAGLALARQQGAHLQVLCLGIDQTHVGYYSSGATAILMEGQLEQARKEARELEEAATKRLRAEDVPYGIDVSVAPTAAVSTVVSRHARFADLVIAMKPYGEGAPEEAPAVIEAAMFQGQAPILILPRGVSLAANPRRIVVAWNGSNEALLAARAALPFLKQADRVDLLIVDPERHEPDRPDPGTPLATMLSRHGAPVDVVVCAQTTTRVSDTILRHTRDASADLLVMGAYGHSRLREAILGGATRNMLAEADIPVLMAN